MTKTASTAPPELDELRRKYPKRARFAEEYARLGAGEGSGGQAALAAGYSAIRANVTACELLRDPMVRAAIEALMRPAIEKVVAEVGVDASRVLDIQAAIAAFEITDVAQVVEGKVKIRDTAEWPPRARVAVAEIAETTNGVRVKLHDRAPALTFLARHLDMAAAVERWELTGKDGGPIKVADATDEQLDARLADLLGKAGAGPTP